MRRAAASIQGRLAWRLGLLFVVVFLGALVLTFARYRAGDLEVPTRLVQKHVREIIAALKVEPDGRLVLAWTKKTPRFDYVFSAWPRAFAVGHPVGCRLLGTEPTDGVYASDHYGVVADLRY